MDAQPRSDLPRFAALNKLPPGYHVVRQLDLSSTRILVLLNLAGGGLLVVGLVVFALVGSALPPGVFNPLAGIEPLPMAVLILLALLVMLTVHEVCHGLAFRVFGAKPRYGVSLAKGVAYASAAEYFLTRDAYLIVALAPLAIITLGTGALMALTDGELRTLVGLMGAANIGGAVGDLWFVRVCRRYPRTLLVRDFGDGAELLACPPGSGALTA